MTNVTLHEGDNRLSLRRLIDEGVRVHSVVTDPPYGLVSIQRRFGKEGSKAARTQGNDGSFARLSGGFMGQAWDGSGIERDPEFWKLIYDILLPGGYVFAFSGSRTGHWQACAMEMAGFIMHPMHGWVFGSGFPKAHNAGQAVEKYLTTGKARRPDRDLGGLSRNRWSGSEEGTLFSDTGGRLELTTSEAAEWDGWAYGTQTQKPALEPIYLGQKPFDCKNGAANLLKHGVGAVNIDGCRVPTASEELVVDDGRRVDMQRDVIHEGYDRPSATMFRTGKPAVRGGPSNTQGRHPANLILDGSPEVDGMFPNSSARFFHQFPHTEDGGLGIDPLFYHPKAGKADRAGSKHPTVKPIALMQYLVRHITPPGGVVLDPFAGSGTTAEAARREGFDCILMEAHEEYLAFLKQRFALADDDQCPEPRSHSRRD